MARMEELSHCVALSERQAQGLLRLLRRAADTNVRLTPLTVEEMRDLEARLELALREDER